MNKTKWFKIIFGVLNAVSIALLGWLFGSGHLWSEGYDYDWLAMACLLIIVIDLGLGAYFIIKFLIRDAVGLIKKYYHYRIFKFSATLICVLILFGGGFLVSRFKLDFNFFAHRATKQAYKAVVKIKTIIQDSQYGMQNVSEGSGTIISPDGKILTNYHVVSEEDSDTKKPKPAGFIICLTSDTSKAPDCNYTAKLVERNKDLDLAILQIEPISGLSKKRSFDYLELNTSDNTKIGDQITALGYPGIGQETITITQGIVSGKNNKYDQDWIKTDAMTSYGNSGGSAIDSAGKIIGIPSEAYADTLGSLGYVINVTSINQWLQDNINKNAQDITFQEQVVAFAKKLHSMLDTRVYANDSPKYTVAMPDEWSTQHNSEDLLYMDKSSDQDGGYVSIRVYNQPRAISLTEVVPILKNSFVSGDDTYYPNVVEEKDAKVSGLAAKKIIYYNKGDKVEGYFLPFENYLVAIRYKYGKDDKDKDKINKIIESIKLEKSKTQSVEMRVATNVQPKFKLQLGADWSILPRNEKAFSASIVNKTIKEAFFFVKVETADETNKNFSNTEYQDDLKKRVEDLNLNKEKMDLKFAFDELKPSVKLNDKLTDWMLEKITLTTDSTNKLACKEQTYTKKIGDKYVSIGFDLYSDKPELYKQAEAKLKELIAGFNLEK